MNQGRLWIAQPRLPARFLDTMKTHRPNYIPIGCLLFIGYVAVLRSRSIVIAIIAHALSRLLYFGFVTGSLYLQDKELFFTKKFGAGRGYRKFKSWASIIMTNDGVSFIILCVVSRLSIVPRGSPAWFYIGGLILFFAGSAIKIWAARTLGEHGYYWHDFFAPTYKVRLAKAGPYRYFENPMYGIGNAHLYGVALMLLSWPGLLAAAFDHGIVFVLYLLVEKPHYEKIREKQAAH